jgi:hypothetical protein
VHGKAGHNRAEGRGPIVIIYCLIKCEQLEEAITP